LDAAPGIRMAATFVESASAADVTTQTFETRFAFTPPDELVILPGMTGLIEGRFRAPADADNQPLSVPLDAILSEAGQTYTWLVDEDTLRVSRRDVVIASGVGDSVGVTQGLEDGDVIVGAGGAYLYEGAEIRLFNQLEQATQ
ncbi:MAG: efflux RND transporter periplasmic adaptor subunit, partial [Pseudomonadota bacterium]